MSSSAKIAAGAATAMLLLPVLLVAAAVGAISAVFGSPSTPSQTALADIPADYLALYQQAATKCPGLDWPVLAAIGKIESDHGRSTLPGITDGTENPYHARGPMQFLQPTFDGVMVRHTIPPGGKNPPSPWDKHDAIFAASFYLCENNASHDLRAAIFAYNHAHWYVNQVLDQAARYRSQATPNVSAACPTIQQIVQQPTRHFSDNRAMTAVQFACSQLGKPYVWGGDGNPGFDCSGLTHAAYQAAGISLPRTAQEQYNTGPRLTPGAPPRPGDLLFFGAPGRIHHVGIALGGSLMVNAPTFGKPVQIQDYRAFGDYVGASRPAETQVHSSSAPT